MLSVAQVAEYLEGFAPSRLAEEWDNVGLLVGDRDQVIERVMTCLTITPASAAEAIERQAQLIVTHHPLPFRPLKRITTDTGEGRLLWALMRAGVAIYSPHTAFDSAGDGINQRLAVGIGLENPMPLVPSSTDASLGSARFGQLPEDLTLQDLADRVKGFLKLTQLQAVGDPLQPVRSVAVACGSAGEFVRPAHLAGCECLVTGETRFHTCLEAEAVGISLLLTGHYASERFGVEHLADKLAAQFPTLEVWASRTERDPLQVL